MKTIPTLAMALSLTLSIQACTTTPHIGVVKSSEVTGHPSVVIRHSFHQLERDGAPKPIQASAYNKQSNIENVDENTDDSTNGSELNTMEEGMVEPSPMSHKIVSIVGQVIVACATSGNCW